MSKWFLLPVVCFVYSMAIAQVKPVHAKAMIRVMGTVEKIEFIQTRAGSVPLFYIVRGRAKGTFTVLIRHANATRNAFLEKYLGEYVELYVEKERQKNQYAMATEKQLRILRDTDDLSANLPE